MSAFAPLSGGERTCSGSSSDAIPKRAASDVTFDDNALDDVVAGHGLTSKHQRVDRRTIEHARTFELGGNELHQARIRVQQTEGVGPQRLAVVGIARAAAAAARRASSRW